MHGFDLILARPAVSQEWLQGGRDRDEEGEDIAQRDVVCRPYAVGAVLASARVAYADLMLIVQPGLVELGPRSVENPLAEATSHGG